MSRRPLSLLIATLGLATGLAQAAPAYYYQWMSKVDGSRVCSQISPGSGWQKMAGPFQDIRCQKKPPAYR